MLEAGLIALFCATLFVSVAVGWSLIPAMLGGLILFIGYGLMRRHPLKSMLRQAVASVRAAGMVIGTFVLISLLTSLWRGSGTIAFIVAYAAKVIHPSTVVPLGFLLCAGMSVLVGSSFATAATMGTICMSLGLSMGASPVWLGGAVLAGIYVGDRCSPVSTSAQLVAQITHTNLFDNLGRMMRTGVVPFALSCAVYAAVAAVGAWLPGFVGAASIGAGASSGVDAGAAASTGASPDVSAILATAFDLSWPTVLPAVLVLVLAVARVDVRLTMAAGIVSSMLLCVGVQHVAWPELARMMMFGYAAPNAQVAALLDGGGVVSMLNVMAIVMISSAYAGIFTETRMLASLQGMIANLGGRIGAFAATLVVALGTVALSCNQTLAIMLTQQLGEGLYAAAAGADGGRAVDSRAVDTGDAVADAHSAIANHADDEDADDSRAADFRADDTADADDGGAARDARPAIANHADDAAVDGEGADDTSDTADGAALADATAGAKARSAQAIDLEDTVVVVAPLVPWCIAGAVPLAVIGAPTTALLVAVFLYLLPLCRLIGALLSARRA